VTTPNHNLPAELTRFVGRERELATIQAMLAKARLLTLTGAGGVGKTRLAIEVAGQVLDAFPDGVWLVELAAITDPARLEDAVARTLGVREEPGRPLSDTLAAALRPRPLLLLLDNCEHLAGACAALAQALLRAGRHLRILATSRQPLGLIGETVWPVPSLSVPNGRGPQADEGLLQYEGVELFVERATAVLPSFRLTASNAAAVAEICRRLDGIPLAIELAAARVRMLPPHQIAERLQDRFALLTGGSPTALPRYQTLRGTLDWSYHLLTDPERVLLRRLAVFAGGWTLEAAEVVCGDEEQRRSNDDGDVHPSSVLPPSSVLDLMAGLVDKSLVVAEMEGEEPRYRYLETVRQYAQDRLRESGEAEAVELRHGAYFLGLAERADPLLSGPNQVAWYRRLEREHDNLRAALRGALDRRATDTALRLGAALTGFWMVLGHRNEGLRWFEELMSLSAETPPALRSKILYGVAGFAQAQCDFDRAADAFRECLALRRELGDHHGVARLFDSLGEMARKQGDYERAVAHLEESLALGRGIGDQYSIALSLRRLASVTRDRGDYRVAELLYNESLAMFRALGDTHWIAHVLDELGGLAQDLGDYERSARLLEESLATFRKLGDKDGLATCLNNLGLLALKRGDGARAATCFKESVALFREINARWGIPGCLEALAGAALVQGRAERAALLLGAADTLRAAIGVPLPPTERPHYERFVTAARASLGESAYAAACAAAQSLPFEQALDYALTSDEVDGPTSAPALAPQGEGTMPLTPRQREVVDLVARGLTNRQIAERLVITEGTARIHLEHIFTKLGLHSRSQLTAWAVTHGVSAPRSN
jgi:predicted ATPase/DNA-binding CsgD family transcriptional regulator